jgi:hypothetical protein
MVWREPKDHSSDCYFCLTNITQFTPNSRYTVQYPDLTLAMKPIPHSEELPVPKPPENLIFNENKSDPDEDHGQLCRAFGK